MRLEVECERVDKLSRAAFVWGRDGVVHALERLRRYLHAHEAMMIGAIIFQRCPRFGKLVGNLQDTAIRVFLHAMKAKVAARARDDKGNFASVEVARESLVVMDVAAENGIRHAPRLLNGLLKYLLHVLAARVKLIDGEDRMVHCHKQRLIGWRACQI